MRDASLQPLLGGYALAVYLDGVNFPAFKVAAYNGSWNELADVSLASTVAFERKGQTVRPRTTSAGVTGVYIAEDQLRGAHFISRAAETCAALRGTRRAIGQTARSTSSARFCSLKAATGARMPRATLGRFGTVGRS